MQLHYWESTSIEKNFNELCDEAKNIKKQYLKADRPLRFVDSIITKFQSTIDAEDSFIISPSLFDENKPIILIDISFCEKNENLKILSKSSTISLTENILFQ